MNISGRLTQNATVSKTTKGKEVVNFSVAVNDGYKNKQGEWVDNTAFIEYAYWRSAKPVAWLKQGLNFTTSSIKPVWGTASQEDSVQASEKKQNSSPEKEDEKDDLPF